MVCLQSYLTLARKTQTVGCGTCKDWLWGFHLKPFSRSSVFFSVCAFNVWPKTTLLLLPVSSVFLTIRKCGLTGEPSPGKQSWQGLGRLGMNSASFSDSARPTQNFLLCSNYSFSCMPSMSKHPLFCNSFWERLLCWKWNAFFSYWRMIEQKLKSSWWEYCLGKTKWINPNTLGAVGNNTWDTHGWCRLWDSYGSGVADPWPRMARDAAQHEIINSLKTFLLLISFQ